MIMIKLLRRKRISNIFSVRGHRTLKPRSKFISKKFILKNLIFFNSKLNGRKLGFNTSLSLYGIDMSHLYIAGKQMATYSLIK